MTAAANGPALGMPGLLVVDGDAVTRQLLRDFLAEAGFASEEAADLQAALVRVQGTPPAAVVLHDHIPGAEGLEILRNLRAEHPDVPVVFIAGCTDPKTRAAVTRLAATAYVDKPFRIAELLTTIVRAVHFPVAVHRRARRPRGAARPRRAALVAPGAAHFQGERTA